MPGICLIFSKKDKKLLNDIYKKINKKNNNEIIKINKGLSLIYLCIELNIKKKMK